MKKIKVIVLCLISIMTMLVLSNNSYANYQSNDGTKKTEKAEIWITEIRKMESEGNVMGLIETTNTDGTYSGNSNNIDVHMQKNTEYGAMVILSASKEYGKQPAAQDTTAQKTSRYVHNYNSKWGNLRTSTGNLSGVSFNSRWEQVAATNENYKFDTIESMYVNRYYIQKDDAGKDIPGDPMPGDAMDISKWHGAGSTSQTVNTKRTVFNYMRTASTNTTALYVFGSGSNTSNDAYSTRAVVVNGRGF